MNQIKMAHVETESLPIDLDNFDLIVTRHQRQIYRTLLCLVRDADTAETLAQECFLRAFRKRDSFRAEASLATWLMSIAVNLAQDHNKSRRWAFWRRLMRTDRIEYMQVADAHRSPEQALIKSEWVKTIQSAAYKLPERQRIVFLLRFVEDLPLAEIAEVLNLETGTVKTHLHRAIEAIRKACARRGIYHSEPGSSLE
jgi:RNA polymerase sigma-70 factor (ECF subfamily)